jgi:hypothetical protein
MAGSDEQDGCFRVHKITLHNVVRLGEVESTGQPVD